MIPRIFLRSLFVGAFLCVVFVLAVPSAFGQTAVRVKNNQTTIWSVGFPTPILVVNTGTVLQVVARRDNWYEVVLPNADAASRRTGLIAVSAVEAVDGAVVPSSPGAAPPVQRVPVARRPPGPKPGFRAYGIVEAERVLATKSFNAVLGKTNLTNYGFALEATNVWEGAFLRLDLTRSSNTGQRVFVDSGQNVFSLHVPVAITITPIEIGGGWRFMARSRSHVLPHVGAALLVQKYREVSTPPNADTDVDATDAGLALFGGADIRFGILAVLVEGQYRTVPKAIGVAGASQDFKETDLGGAVLRIGVGVGF